MRKLRSIIYITRIHENSINNTEKQNEKHLKTDTKAQRKLCFFLFVNEIYIIVIETANEKCTTTTASSLAMVIAGNFVLIYQTYFVKLQQVFTDCWFISKTPICLMQFRACTYKQKTASLWNQMGRFFIKNLFIYNLHHATKLLCYSYSRS